ncbi:type 1 fimbrial protein [Pseudomonas fragi]|uniref:type 1 fimbrial protein n=1 Tax=Pseudomonas fragi TaxID=296 RepID=UPI0021BE900A|nr:type 1 fimbrial protein [Pseudomonas fragi]UXL37058.1 type 1 fimbrial protein [Pseudomonas fragi]
MNNNRLAICAILLFVLSSSSLAATPLGQGVIQFNGSIVESGCTTNVRVSSTFELQRCPRQIFSNEVNVQKVESAGAVRAAEYSSVKVKLLASGSSDGRYYNQQYGLVDRSGKPVLSGSYLITVISP